VPESQTIVLTDEEGQEHEFEIINVLEVDDGEYAILVNLEDDQAIALRLERDEGGQEFLVEIDDDEEWDRVAKAWNEYQEDQ